MKNFTFASILFMALLSMTACNTVSLKSQKLNSDADSASYMVGLSVGFSLVNQKATEEDINTNLLKKGIEDAFSGDTAFTMQEINMYLQEYMNSLMEKEGEEFLALNKAKDGVLETESGLQYKIIVEGTGRSPADPDTVICHYKGSLTNGETFDSSYDRGEPAKFPLRGVIRGWTEGLQLMKEGGKYELYVPHILGYGPRATRSGIPPYSTLIFEIELLEVIPGESNE
ncbi:Outer membrane protein MIP [subsurface metagenome]